MPQESSITFSPGQASPADANQVTTSAFTTDNPIYEFGAALSLGANQSAPSEDTFSPAQPSTTTASLTENADPAIPRGATFRPQIKFAIAGRNPRLKTRQLWEGTVTEVLESGFAAILRDKTDPSNPEEQVSFEFDQTEISPEDLKFVNPGSSFYWIIGNECTAAGQVKNVSMVQFRRMPTWTQRRLQRAADHARRLRDSFQEEA